MKLQDGLILSKQYVVDKEDNSSYFILSKLPLKLYWIYLWNFTDGLIISRQYVANKEDYSGCFGFWINFFAKNQCSVMLSSCPTHNS